MKYCVRCEETKSWDEFSKDKSNRGGLQSWCKACVAKHRALNRVQIAERERAYYRTNRKRISKRKQDYYQKNRDSELKRNRQYYSVNRERFAENKRKWHEINRERNLAQGPPASGSKGCRSCGQELRVDEFGVDTTRLDGLGASCKYCSNRSRIRRKSQLRDRIIESNDGRCGICGEDLDAEVHLDHIVPLAVGGEDEEWNLQPAHATCNMSKGDRGLDESGLFLYSTCYEDL